MTTRPMIVTDQRIRGNTFHFKGVFPHLEVVLHPVIDESTDRHLRAQRRNDDAYQECEQVEDFLSFHDHISKIGIAAVHWVLHRERERRALSLIGE